MQSWNLTNLDVEAKACLELLLRPNVLGVIPRWLVKATPEQKKALCKIGKHIDCKKRGTLPQEQLRPADDEFAKLKYRRNEAIKINSYGHERHVSDNHITMDRSSSDIFRNVHLLASNSHNKGGRVREPGLGGANNLHCEFRSRKQVQDYYVLGKKPLHQQNFAKILNPSVTKMLGELVLAHTDDSTNNKILESLEDIGQTFHQVPIYIDFKAPKAKLVPQGEELADGKLRTRRPSSAPTGPRPSSQMMPKQAVRPASATHTRPETQSGSPVQNEAQTQKLLSCAGKKLPVANTTQKVLYSFSKTDPLRFPSCTDFEVSCLPPEVPYEEPPPPPPPPGLRRDQVSQVYFPGNAQKQNTTYQDTFGPNLRRPSSTSSIPDPQKGEQIYKQSRTLLSPRMFESLRRRPGTIDRRPFPLMCEVSGL